jgi:quinol monooxygenase YgiN
MITIIAKSIVKEGMKLKFLEKATELIKSSRAEEGCLSYNLYEDINDSKIMTFIEEWIDEKAIQIHNNSEHFTRIVPELAKLRESKPELNLYKPVFSEWPEIIY